MKSVNTMFSLNDKLELSLKQEYMKAMTDPKFKRLVGSIKIDENLLIKYTSQLQDASVEFDNCMNCKGLSECKNKIKGFVCTPSESGKRIVFTYKECHFSSLESYKDNVILYDIPKTLKNSSMSSIYKGKNRIEILKGIKSFYSNYNTSNQEKGIYLHGSFGSGKTYLIAALFNELAKKNIKGVILHVPELLRGLKESFDTDYKERFDLIKKCELLLLDDIGAEYLTGWGRDEVIEPILQYRMDEGLSTFFTSNFNLEELEKHFSITNNSIDKVKARRIIERIKQLSNPIELVSENLRK